MHFQTVNPLILTLKIDVLTAKIHELLSIFTASINNKPSANRQDASGTRPMQHTGDPAHRLHLSPTAHRLPRSHLLLQDCQDKQ
jgi:hypothetical protein